MTTISNERRNLMKQRFRLKNLTLKNRLVMPPMATRAATKDGKVTDAHFTHYEARIRGGHIGLAVTEHAYVSEQGRASEGMLSLASDVVLPGLTRLVELFHRYDTPVLAQLNHAGCATTTEITGKEVIGAGSLDLPPVAIAKTPFHSTPRMIRADELPALVDSYVQAAGRAKTAGYDGVVIHSAHAYLLNQFYSPLTNNRTDEYGGSLENRLRLHAAIVKAVREETGEDFLIAVRLGACDHADGGHGVAEAVEAAKILETAGIDLMDISGGMCRYTLDGHEEPGYFGAEAKAIREAVQVPVLLTGGIKTLADAQDLLDKGYADMIGVGRALLQNPDWAEEAFS